MRRGALTLAALLALMGLGLGPAAHAAGPPIPASPARWVTDTAGFLSPTRRAALDTQLEGYQKQSGHQVVVWIGDTLAGAALDDWSVKTFAAWKIGRKGVDDGVAMFIFASDRKIDIEVGYGLEGQVPDAIANRVIQDVMAPKLRAGDPDGAVQAGVDALLTAIEGKPVAAPAGPTSPTGPPRGRQGIDVARMIGIGIVVVLFILLLIFNPRLAMLLLWSAMGRGGGGFGGGGGGGGGFSGGGGRSGGGGARGSW